MQTQKTEASRRELELERAALDQREADLKQREASLEQARIALDEALASSRQAVAAMEAQMQSQQQESSRLLSDSEAEVRRLRKALDDAVASKEALREKDAMELGASQRAAKKTEERRLAQERRLLSEIDRKRMATRQTSAELDKVQRPLHVGSDQRRQQPRSNHYGHVFGVLCPPDRKVAQDHVTHGPTAERGDEGDHRDAEDVHVAAAGRQSTGHGFSHDGDDIDEGHHADASGPRGTCRMTQTMKVLDTEELRVARARVNARPVRLSPCPFT